MNTEERLKKLLAEVNAPQTVEERLDAIERTLAMAFEVQAAQQKLILMLCDRYGRSERQSSPTFTFMGVPFKDIHSSSSPEWVKEAYAKWLAGHRP